MVIREENFRTGQASDAIRVFYGLRLLLTTGKLLLLLLTGGPSLRSQSGARV